MRGELDWWDSRRWTKNILAVRARHAIEHLVDLLKHKGRQTLFRGLHNDEWLWPGDVPRTCSYCGSIHPVDALRLVSEGWEVEGTGKSYKRYLNPPGYRNVLQDYFDAKCSGEKRWKNAYPWSPVPPVKLYVDHLTRDQVERLNAIHRVNQLVNQP